MLRRFVAISLLTISSATVAGTLDIDLSNSAAQFRLTAPSSVAGRSDLYASLMYNDVNSIMGEGGLLVTSEEGHVRGLSLGLGAKAVVASLNKIAPSRKLASGFALGGQIRYEVPSDRRVAFVGEYYFAPKIITFSNADHFYQAEFRVEYAISPLTQAYLGYRTTKFFMMNNLADGVMDDGAHIGVRLSF